MERARLNELTSGGQNTASADPADTSPALTRDAYYALRQRACFEPNLPMVVLSVLGNQLLFLSALWLLQRPSMLSHLGAQLLLPIAYFQAFALMHDCAHGSCVKLTANAVLGHYLSVFCFLPYYPWKYEHARHHAWTNHADKDPTVTGLRAWSDAQHVPWVARAAWRTWLPVAAIVQHLGLWAQPWRVRHQRSKREVARGFASLLWLCVVYATVHHVWPATISVKNLWPSIALYLVYVELVNFPHHGAKSVTHDRLPLWQQPCVTRSSRFPAGVSEVLMFNFNFHVEHHLLPALPWYRLRSARPLVKSMLGAHYEEVPGLSWTLGRRRQALETVLQIPASHPPTHAATASRQPELELELERSASLAAPK